MLEKRGRTMVVLLIHNVGWRRKFVNEKKEDWVGMGARALSFGIGTLSGSTCMKVIWQKINTIEKWTRGHDCLLKTTFLTLACC